MQAGKKHLKTSKPEVKEITREQGKKKLTEDQTQLKGDLKEKAKRLVISDVNAMETTR